MQPAWPPETHSENCRTANPTGATPQASQGGTASCTKPDSVCPEERTREDSPVAQGLHQGTPVSVIYQLQSHRKPAPLPTVRL